MLNRNNYAVRLDWQEMRFYRELIERVRTTPKQPSALPSGALPSLSLLSEMAEGQWDHYLRYGDGYAKTDIRLITAAVGYVTLAMELIEDHHVLLDKYYRADSNLGSLVGAERTFVVGALALFTLLEKMERELRDVRPPSGVNIRKDFLNEILRERLTFANHLCDLAVGLAGNDPQGDEAHFARKWRGKRTDVRKKLGTAWTDAAKFDQHHDHE